MFGLLDNVFLKHLTKVVTYLWDVGMIIVGVGGWQIIQVWMIILLATILNVSNHNLGIQKVHIIGWVLWLVGLGIETITQINKNPMKILLWWGTFIVVTPQLKNGYSTFFVDPIFITLFLFMNGILKVNFYLLNFYLSIFKTFFLMEYHSKIRWIPLLINFKLDLSNFILKLKKLQSIHQRCCHGYYKNLIKRNMEAIQHT